MKQRTTVCGLLILVFVSRVRFSLPISLATHYGRGEWIGRGVGRQLRFLRMNLILLENSARGTSDLDVSK